MSEAARVSNPPDSLDARWDALLKRIVVEPDTHARWLNTLALMEHIGSRKMMKALDSETLDEVMLRHVAEETRHAYIFKRLSQRVAPGLCPTFAEPNLFEGEAARAYFQGLDRGVHDWVRENVEPERQALVSYLSVTQLIEQRASQIYPRYEAILQQAGQGLSLRPVIAEEARHLAEMDEAFERIGFHWRRCEKPLSNREAPLFEAWTGRLEDALFA
jgi:rubrerythrin